MGWLAVRDLIIKIIIHLIIKIIKYINLIYHINKYKLNIKYINKYII